MTSSGDDDRFETVIIGGGQAGLAVGYHLARRERAFVILDVNERIGDSWRRRWDSLRVFTPARYDGLPGWSFPAAGWSYPTKDEVADYLESYAARFRLPVRTGIRIDGLSREDGGYVITSGLSRYEADNVVVATGGYQAPRIPVFASELHPDIVQLHSSEYRSPSQLREGGVLVVGAGNSGAEIALESSARHPTWLSGRDTGQEPVRAGGGLPDRLFTPPFWFLLSHVLTLRTPIGRRVRHQLSNRGLPLARVGRKDLVRAGVQRVPRVTGVRDGLPMLADGGIRDVANVIWCTGFVSDFSWIDLPVFDRDGEPRHQRGVVPSEPGLYFIGLFFLSAGSSSLIGGVGRDARHIARHIASQRAEGGGAGQEAFRTSEKAPDWARAPSPAPATYGDESVRAWPYCPRHDKEPPDSPGRGRPTPCHCFSHRDR
jgi:putative flavoprotein involved in K+ transport